MIYPYDRNSLLFLLFQRLHHWPTKTFFQSFDIEGPASGFYYAGTAETVLTATVVSDAQQANYGNHVGQCETGACVFSVER